MILEVAELNIKDGKSFDFEIAFAKAQKIIRSMKGYISHELLKCIEIENRYLLHIHWETVEDHEVGFRKSVEYQQWKKNLHHFYDPFPDVWHYNKLELIV